MCGDFHEAIENYDLITVVILRLGKYGEQSEGDAIRFFSTMLSMERSYEEKISSLSDEFKMQDTKEISKEVLRVCNRSTGVHKKEYDSGYDSGVSDGKRRMRGRKPGRRLMRLPIWDCPLKRLQKL